MVLKRAVDQSGGHGEPKMNGAGSEVRCEGTTKTRHEQRTMQKTVRRGQDADQQDGRRCKKRNGGWETNA